MAVAGTAGQGRRGREVMGCNAGRQASLRQQRERRSAQQEWKGRWGRARSQTYDSPVLGACVVAATAAGAGQSALVRQRCGEQGPVKREWSMWVGCIQLPLSLQKLHEP